MTFETRFKISSWSTLKLREVVPQQMLARASSWTPPSKCRLPATWLISRQLREAVVRRNGEGKRRRRVDRLRRVAQHQPSLTKSRPDAAQPRLKMSFLRSPVSFVSTLTRMNRLKFTARLNSKRKMKCPPSTRWESNLLETVGAKSKLR